MPPTAVRPFGTPGKRREAPARDPYALSPARDPRAPSPARDAYALLGELDGRHPLQAAAPEACVLYGARRRRGSRVRWFNADLARDMGLIPAGHDGRLDPGLERALLAAFSLQIVNEYDLAHGTRIAPRDRLPRRYMATRYLQIQHASRRGTTSGDGRSVWNGTVRTGGVTWDVTSCGTGATRLCPATATTHRFYKTGSRRASYGCGTASLEEGITAALMSEVFHRNGLPTERVLAVLELASGHAITVRAGRNLLRPSHFFAPLKQGDRARLAALVDLHLARQAANGAEPWIADPAARYAAFAETMARTFGRTAATFEREYVFCWLEWDGDNVLADGGIIDYGSIRQFGLFHREYRYDDGPRFSTTIGEQRRKARYIVQCAAQIRDFLVTGRKPRLSALRRDPVLKVFDAAFAATRDRLLLRQVGFDEAAADALLRHDLPLLRRFDRAHRSFERACSRRGLKRVPDGITRDALFSTRDLLRELPRHYLASRAPLPGRTFLEIGLSSYARGADRRVTPTRLRRAREFQVAYLLLVARAARRTGRSEQAILELLRDRAAVIDRFARITGDSVCLAARALLRRRRRLGTARTIEIMRAFIEQQTLDPDRPTPSAAGERPSCRTHPTLRPPGHVLRRLNALVAALRHGL